MMEGVCISDDIVGQVTESFSGGIQSHTWIISMACRICGTALVDRSERLMGDKSIRSCECSYGGRADCFEMKNRKLGFQALNTHTQIWILIIKLYLVPLETLEIISKCVFRLC